MFLEPPGDATREDLLIASNGDSEKEGKLFEIRIKVPGINFFF